MADGLLIGLYALKALGLFLATLTAAVWGYAFSLRRKLSDILLRWESPDFGIWTAVLFSMSLAFLSGGMLGYALYVKHATAPEISALWQSLSTLSFGLVGLVGILYLGLRAQYMQSLSERGYYYVFFNWQTWSWHVELILWEEVYDYYVHTDEALSVFTLLLRDQRKIHFQAPAHLREVIERAIDYGIDKYAFLQRYGRKVTRSSSEP